MSSESEMLPPPNDPIEFESLCLDLWKELWADSGAQKNGRSGQPQSGVDIFGQEQGRWIGIQCKQKDGLLRSKLTKRELDDEVKNALNFEPKLQVLILATSGPRDAKVQKRAREITEEHKHLGLFKVQVWSWDDIWHALYSCEKLLKQIRVTYWPRLISQHSKKEIANSSIRHRAEKFFGREADLKNIDNAWKDTKTHILAIMAWGGVGKTSLVVEWMARRAAAGWSGFERVFDWSFYDQGTRAQGATSTDLFIASALEFFGRSDGKELAKSTEAPWVKGKKLAGYIHQYRSLLVLDGLEPLQTLDGQLRDNDALTVLLECLAQQPKNGLCIVTTRIGISNLNRWMDKTVFYQGQLEHKLSTYPQLSPLSINAGVKLLKTIGVVGSSVECQNLVKEVRGHALTLDLMGRYLVKAHHGDIRRRDMIRFEKADIRIQGGHAFRVIASYEKWFSERGTDGARQLAVLRLLGLFDRAVDVTCLAALFDPNKEVIIGLTEPLLRLDEDSWNCTLSSLADCRLITLYFDPSPDKLRIPRSVDTHPLIREYFAEKLRKDYPDARLQAHRRLYDYLTGSTVDKRAPTLDDLQPLYQAMIHACHAENYEIALNDVYLKRIQRGPLYYSTTRIGGFASNLAAMRGFFEKWEPNWVPKSKLNESLRATIFLNTGYCLRALVKMQEASICFRKALSSYENLHDSSSCAIVSGMLCILYAFQGALSKAARLAENGVLYADKSKDNSLMMNNRTILAHVCLQRGDMGNAERFYDEAFRILHRNRNRLDRARVATTIIRYCAFLETKGLIEEMKQQAETAIDKLYKPSEHGSIYCGMLRWCLGCACLALARKCSKGRMLARAEEELRGALKCFRQGAGILLEQPRVYQALAEVLSDSGDAEGASTALDEAWEIANRGLMRLNIADIHLLRVRLFHAVNPYPWESPCSDIVAARNLIKKCHYKRRAKDLKKVELLNSKIM